MSLTVLMQAARLKLTPTRFTTFLKEYWFLLTFVGSLVVTVGSYIVYGISPLEKFREIRDRGTLIEFHNRVGRTHLDLGNFALAKAEFEHALKLNSSDLVASTGSYLADLFVAMDSPNWDPAATLTHKEGSADNEGEFRLPAERGFSHVARKYIADVNERIGSKKACIAHLKEALREKSDYVDALFAYGWVNYEVGTVAGLDEMEKSFKRITDIAPHDYRGRHGYGYALYMRAAAEPDAAKRTLLIAKAAEQSKIAIDLNYRPIHVRVDLGEVIRSVSPKWAVKFHEDALSLLENPQMMALSQNQGGWSRTVLKPCSKSDAQTNLCSPRQLVSIYGAEEKKLLVKAELSLDYLAAARLSSSAEDAERLGKSHRQLADEVRASDKRGQVWLKYMDQLRILDVLLPN